MPRQNRPMFGEITANEIDIALESILKDQVMIDGDFGTKTSVPVFIRDRDSKMIPDLTSTKSLIFFEQTEQIRGDAAYGTYDNNCQVIARDELGDPLKFRVKKMPAPTWELYTVTVRAHHIKDIRDIQRQMNRIFPVNHRTLVIKGVNIPLYRDGFNNADIEDLGIYIREWNLRIVGFSGQEDKGKVVSATRSIELEVTGSADRQESLDPEAPVNDLNTDIVEIC